MINEIHPHKIHLEYTGNKSVSDNDYILCFKDDTLLWKVANDEFSIPQRKDFRSFPEQAKITFLFTFDKTPCFLVEEEPEITSDGFIFNEITFFRTFKHKEWAWVSLVAYHLNIWYLNNQFCGRCGTKTTHKTDERAMICPVCNHVVYPQIAPAVIVAVTCGEKILLIRGKGSKLGWHSLVAGFVDVGETFEDAVKREVFEETGIVVHNVRYYKNQPWPLSNSIMVGFVAEADDNQTIKIDENELSEAGWFHRGNLPDCSPNLSVGGEMIERFNFGIL
jgi:NAD+ diphosphatase